MIVLPADLLKLLGEQPFDALMNTEGQIFRKQPLRETARIELNGRYYFIKKHRGISLAECFKNWFSGRMPVIGAEPEWLAIQALTALDIPTTPLVGYGQRGWWPFSQESFILTESLDDCLSLEEVCQSWTSAPPSLHEKRQLIAEIARITRVIHQQGWVHRDLYLCHFLRDQNKQLHLIDLHRMQQPRYFKSRWVIKDLAGLLFSSLDYGLTRSDVIYFIKEYTQCPLREAIAQNESLLKATVFRALQLYQKSHHDYPLQSWMHTGKMRLPRKNGSFHERYYLGEFKFESVEALRVLPTKRWVIKGNWRGKFAVLKVFSEARDFERELSGAQALRKAHILSPEILYQGRLNQYYAMVYSYIDHAHPIADLTSALIGTMAVLHDAGLVQTDCHRENFLQKESRIYVLDAGSIKIYPKVSDDIALRNLACLFSQWPAKDDFQNLPLFLYYSQTRHLVDVGRLQTKLIDMIGSFRLKARKTWLKKIFRDCTAIKTKWRFSTRYCMRREFDNLYTQTLFNYPEAYFHENAHYLKRGNSATVIHTRLGEHDLVIKRFNRKNWLIRFKRYVTPSKAARAWKMSHAMETIGIATPKPLAFIEKRFGPFRLDSYFITEFTPGERLDRLSSLADCANALNLMMDALDYAMCEHGDLKASNILWDGKTLYLLDTDAAKFYNNRRRFKAAHEADWQRLLRNWDHPILSGDDNV